MVSYLQCIKDTESKFCSPEVFDQLTNSPMVKQLIEDYRKGNKPAKSLLPTFMFQGYDPKVLEGKKGSRLAKDLRSTGLFIMDFDHIDNPMELFHLFEQKFAETIAQGKLALAHITPSGEGVRLVELLPDNMSIEEAQKMVAERLEVKMDSVVKDLSRQSFCPQASDILYINKELLFSTPDNSDGSKGASLRAATVGGHQCPGTSYPVTKKGVPSAQIDAGQTGQAEQAGRAGQAAQTGQAGQAEQVGRAGLAEQAGYAGQAEQVGRAVCPEGTALLIIPAQSAGKDLSSYNAARRDAPLQGSDSGCFNTHFRGIPYTRIVEELITVLGGTPEEGNRELTLFRLASDMAKITGRSAPWLESILPTFGLPEAEWRATIAGVCKKPIETGYSRTLQEALRRCRVEDANGDGEISIDEYKDNFPEKAPVLIKLLTSRCMPHMKPALSQLCFPALAAHVAQHKFLMSDNSTQELGIMAVLIGRQSNGKSCIDEPIRLIVEDIVAVDNINRQREREYNEAQRNRKANERGAKRPEDIIIRCLGGNCSNPKLLELLTAAESGDKEHPNQCLYSEVTEIQRLYKMGTDNGKFGVSDLIKAAFDRQILDSNRFSATACNAYTPARWNFSAATTPEGARRFFSGVLLTDGTLSRVAFVMLPVVDIPSNNFKLGDYDDDFKRQLAGYINNLNNYKHPTDSCGKAIPVCVPQANALRAKINDIIDIEKYAEEDKDTYVAYAYRTRDIIVREALTVYIANGCVWEDCEDYWLWAYSELMRTKLAVFGTLASERFAEERVVKSGRKAAISFMPKQFTREMFYEFCKNNPNICKNPKYMLGSFVRNKLVAFDGETYTIKDEVCNLYGIA